MAGLGGGGGAGAARQEVLGVTGPRHLAGVGKEESLGKARGGLRPGASLATLSTQQVTLLAVLLGHKFASDARMINPEKFGLSGKLDVLFFLSSSLALATAVAVILQPISAASLYMRTLSLQLTSQIPLTGFIVPTTVLLRLLLLLLLL